MKLATAANLYSQHRMSLHQTMLLAGLDEFTFRQHLGDHGVPVFDLSRDELASELT